MASVVGALATSHAFAFLEPDRWDARRERMRSSYERRYGTRPGERPELHEEDTDANGPRFSRWRASLDTARDCLTDARPDVLLIVGDDQNEVFSGVQPQFAVFTGERCLSPSERHSEAPFEVRCDATLATELLRRSVAAGFDTAKVDHFQDDVLKAHAHAQPLEHLGLAGHVCVPVFVNAIHVPAPEPTRCVEFGRTLAATLADLSPQLRVGVVASGGMSHFTAGYPWPTYRGPHTLGSVDVDFDREVVAALEAGDETFFRSLTAADLLEHGDPEMRALLVLLGMVNFVPPTTHSYEPFFQAAMGMLAAGWRLGDQVARM
jgi:aromatic ring-opening dioxygenase LigB subunit